MLKYVICKAKLKIDFDICEKDLFFTLSEFEKTDTYIFEIKQKMFSYLQSPHFNSIILFDLNYSKNDIDKIKNMLLNQTDDDIAILNVDNKDVKELYVNIKEDSCYKAKIVPISTKKILANGASFINNEIYLNVNDKNDEILTGEFTNLNGDQNKINILATFTLLSQCTDIQQQEIIETLYNFKPSNDIFELVLHNENFTFINDINNINKSQSLISFDNIYWILCADEIDFEFDNFLNLEEYFNKVKYVFLIGKYNDKILELFRKHNVQYFIVYNMNNVFNKIEEFCNKEKKEEKITVLLSSINNIENSDFYHKCSNDFEKLVNKEK